MTAPQSTRARVERVVLAYPIGTEFTTADIADHFDVTSRKTPPMRDLGQLLRGIPSAVLVRRPRGHNGLAIWRRV